MSYFSLQHTDILNPAPSDSILNNEYTVCHDKGTYDAISLTPDTAKDDRLKYIQSVSR